MKQKPYILLFVAGLFLFNSCSVFQSKYIYVEQQDGAMNRDVHVKISEEKLIASDSANKAVLNLILNAHNNELRSDNDWLGYTFQLTNEYDKAVNYKLLFAHDSIIKGVVIQDGNYNITLIDDNLQQLDIPVGSFKITAGQEKEIHLALSKTTTTVSYTTKKKVLRKEYKRKSKSAQ